jgi:hypothetical protein
MDELVIDTSYLLPVFGVGLGFREYERRFPAVLRRYSVIYNPASLIEAKWIVLKMAREKPGSKDALLEAYRTGLKVLASIAELKQSAMTDYAIEEVADLLLTRDAVKDYFDRLVYATAACRRCSLLTEDEQLHEVARRGKTRPKEVMRWTQLLRALT